MNLSVTAAAATEPCELSAAEAAAAIAAGELSSKELVTSCLERIAQRDAQVKAWAHLDPNRRWPRRAPPMPACRPARSTAFRSG